MSKKKTRKRRLHIQGMHCASCEVLIERNFKQVPGVVKVKVNYATGLAELQYAKRPELPALQAVVREHGYTLSLWRESEPKQKAELLLADKKRDYIELTTVVLVILALYLVLQRFNLVPKLSVSENMGYGFVFAIGLVAAVSSCMAVTGGLLVSLAARYNEQNPNLTGYQKFKPHLYFNVGRVVSYTVLGGVVGALGSVLTLSMRVNGVITILASVVMIILGFQLLKLFPGLKRWQPKMPKSIAHKIHDVGSASHHPAAPFFLGASTFFLPCGFTQVLQLYVLSTGSVSKGALTMLAFSLGTLPALLSLSVVSSFAKGSFERYFTKFAGVLVVIIGLFNINNGLALVGVNVDLASLWRSSGVQSQSQPVTSGTDIKTVNGNQVVKMKVIGYEYSPAQFTVKQGVPVEWLIDGSQAAGCAQIISSSVLGLNERLPSQGIKIIVFTPASAGTIPFSCPMGMTTHGAAFTVY